MTSEAVSMGLQIVKNNVDPRGHTRGDLELQRAGQSARLDGLNGELSALLEFQDRDEASGFVYYRGEAFSSSEQDLRKIRTLIFEKQLDVKRSRGILAALDLRLAQPPS